MHTKFAIATRFYGLTKDDVKRLAMWVDAALAVVPASNIYVAIRTEEDLSDSLAFMHENYPDVVSFPVIPWGKVVQAPNALLIKAAEQQMTHLFFVSTEYPITEPLVSLLVSHVDSKTLVVGARLVYHDFKAYPREVVEVERANGSHIPWNTFAAWSVERLVHTGFVLAADSLHDPNNAGMEEMGTIAAQQILWPGNALAKLVDVPKENLVLNTYGWNIKRQERYIHNMESKNSRSTSQLERLRLPSPMVLHIG